jgi:hypothetical protein
MRKVKGMKAYRGHIPRTEDDAPIEDTTARENKGGDMFRHRHTPCPNHRINRDQNCTDRKRHGEMTGARRQGGKTHMCLQRARAEAPHRGGQQREAVVVVVAIVVVRVVVVADTDLGPAYHHSSSSRVVPVVRRQTFPLSSGFPAPPVGGVLTTACGGAVAFPGTRGGGIGSAPVKRGRRSVCHLQDSGMMTIALALTPPAPPTRGRT